MKKKWTKPLLTIVAKSTTEENVLDACKSRFGGGPDLSPCYIQGPNACRASNPS